MFKQILLAAALLGIPTLAHAQATPTSKLEWDQNAGNLTEAQAITYRYYPDTVPGGTVLSPVTCVGPTSPFVCNVPFPAFTPGSHTLSMTAGNDGGESLKSSPLNFTFVVIPNPPTNLRIR